MRHNTDTDKGRRRFLRNIGIFTAAGALAACGAETSSAAKTEKAGTGDMTLRSNPNTGDKVSLLGFGCMRFPTLGAANGTDDTTLDQEAINELIDHALKHGVNYFDTSPAYCKGQSEAAVGTALSRHQRDSYFIATKLSNFDPSTWPREKSIAMFNASLQNLRTDYIDYLLLHGIGMGGMEAFNGRYIDNGILDFLKEKHILFTHGGGFHWDQPDHFRVVFLPEVSVLSTAADRLNDFLSTYHQN